MKEKINFIIGEIIRLSPQFSENNWEVMFRYLVKLNSILSNKNNCSDNEIFAYMHNLINRVNNEKLKPILNIYFSQILYNRVQELKTPMYIGQHFDKKLPDFVDKNKVKNIEKLFEDDPIFLKKNIHIHGGWLNLKDYRSFKFDI